jgi:tetratricopeptide (TPR) repeat protein
MKQRRSVIFSLLLSGVTWLAGCQTGPPAGATQHSARGQSPALAEDNLPPEQRAEAYARFATGYSYELSERPDRAFEEYYKTVQLDPSNDGLVVDVARHLLERRQIEQAWKLLARSAKRADADGTVYAWYSRACLALGKTNEAEAAGIEAVRRSPDALDGYESLFRFYSSHERQADALKVLLRAEKAPDPSGPFLLGLADEFEIWLRSSPKEAASIKPKVLSLLKRAAEESFDDPVLRQRLADQLLARGESKTAGKLYLELLDEFEDSPGIREALRERLAGIYLQSKDPKKASAQLEAIVRDNPTRYPQAYYLLGSMAFDARDYGKAADYFSKLKVISPDLDEAYYDLALVKITVDQPTEALEILDQARSRFQQSFRGEFFTALAFVKTKNFAESVRHFNTAEVVGKATEPKRIDAPFYFQFGAACERNKQYEEAERNFLKALKLQPRFAECLNYLGYMWADRNEKLDRALDLIGQAVQIQPKNGAYLDSMGWVFYRLKRYDEALKYELQAVQNLEEPDPSVYDHLGDIYTALNQIGKAREAWQKSLKIEPSEEIRKKLEAAAKSSS